MSGQEVAYLEVLSFEQENPIVIKNMKLNDLRIIICWRKPEVTVERISVEKLMERGIHCSYNNSIQY